MDLGEFLLARIAEDEAAAQAATPGPWRWDGNREADEADLWGPPDGSDAYARPVITASGMHTEGYIYVAEADAAHIARHDPARVLAECEAKRRIVEVHQRAYHPGDYWTCTEENSDWPCATLRLLALPYADHPHYREEWRP